MYTEELIDLLRDSFDIELLTQSEEPENEDGHLTYNIPGKAFARDGSGGEFILLEDGTVGYWGTEGQCGRMAENMTAFFTLIVNCPYWMDVVTGAMYSDPFASDESLQALLEELEAEYDHITPEDRQQAAQMLGVSCEEDCVELVKTFYDCANRIPGLVSTYREDDGSTHDSTGSLFLDH